MVNRVLYANIHVFLYYVRAHILITRSLFRQELEGSFIVLHGDEGLVRRSYLVCQIIPSKNLILVGRLL